MEHTTQKIKDLLLSLMFKAEDATADTDLVKDLNFDSLDRVEVVMGIEKEFGIEISDDDMEGAKTFGDLVRLVNRLRRAGR